MLMEGILSRLSGGQINWVRFLWVMVRVSTKDLREKTTIRDRLRGS